MAKQDDTITLDGQVVEILPNTMFRVKIPNFDTPLLATISGRMRKNNIKVLLGDTVELEISPYDTTRGRISRRR
jgi:translation initiation factor IF-1